jgi:hypothetical protein
MKEKDNLSELVQILQNEKPPEPKNDTRVVTSDGTVVILDTKSPKTT